MKTTYCIKCKKDTDNIGPKMFKTKKQINYAIKM